MPREPRPTARRSSSGPYEGSAIPDRRHASAGSPDLSEAERTLNNRVGRGSGGCNPRLGQPPARPGPGRDGAGRERLSARCGAQAPVAEQLCLARPAV
jgi:hypothetical protein